MIKIFTFLLTVITFNASKLLLEVEGVINLKILHMAAKKQMSGLILCPPDNRGGKTNGD